MNRFLKGCLTVVATAPVLSLACTNLASVAPHDETSTTAQATPSTASNAAEATQSQSGEATQWLVTIDGNDAGWVVIDRTSQWLSPDCRSDLEAQGAWFETVPWDVLESTVDPVVTRSCAEIGQPIAADSPTPTVSTPPLVAPDWGGAQLSRGINFAGDFEVEPRGAWGQPIPDEDFALAAAAGFDHVRVPIRWSSHTGAAPDYRIDPSFMAEVDRLVDLSHVAGLTIVIDVHHFEELDTDPVGERARYLAIWEQLADHYQDEPATVVFELLNEPIGLFNDQPELWNELAAEALSIVRRTNPTRTVIIGPVSYNHADRLDDLQLPQDDNLVATIHTYDPDSFTTQGAVFIDPVPATGITWRADNASVAFGWQQQSWDVGLAPTTDGISIEWGRAFAAFALGTLEDPIVFDEVQVTASAAFDAAVLCNYGTDVQASEVTWTGNTGVADVSGCGLVNSLALQHVGSDLAPVTLSRFAGCAASCEEMIMTQWDSVDALIEGAADWAEGQGVPLYIGEFGTYNSPDTPIDPESRFAWTNAVRTSAEKHGAGWAYFAMSDEFGAYDRTTGVWIPEVIDALLD